MLVLSIRLTSNKLKKLQTQASLLNKNLNFYVKSIILPPQGSYTAEQWLCFTNIISIGRTFRIYSKQGDSSVSFVVDFAEKQSGHSDIHHAK